MLEMGVATPNFSDALRPLVAEPPVADLGFHEGGFVRSGALARPRKFLKTTPTSGQKPRPFA